MKDSNQDTALSDKTWSVCLYIYIYIYGFTDILNNNLDKSFLYVFVQMKKKSSALTAFNRHWRFDCLFPSIHVWIFLGLIDLFMYWWKKVLTWTYPAYIAFASLLARSSAHLSSILRRGVGTSSLSNSVSIPTRFWTSGPRCPQSPAAVYWKRKMFPCVTLNFHFNGPLSIY